MILWQSWLETNDDVYDDLGMIIHYHTSLTISNAFIKILMKAVLDFKVLT